MTTEPTEPVGKLAVWRDERETDGFPWHVTCEHRTIDRFATWDDALGFVNFLTHEATA